MGMEELSDVELVAQIQSASNTAESDQFTNELFRRHYSRVSRWCFRFTGDREAAADVAQEIFIKAYRNLASFQGHSKFSTWLYSITKSQCINAVKAKFNRRPDDGDDALIGLADTRQEDPYLALQREDSEELLRGFLNDTLDPTEKTVFTLHYGEDVSLDTISRLLRLENPSGAKAYIVSAKRKLSKAVQRWKAHRQRTRAEGRVNYAE